MDQLYNTIFNHHIKICSSAQALDLKMSCNIIGTFTEMINMHSPCLKSKTKTVLLCTEEITTYGVGTT